MQRHGVIDLRADSLLAKVGTQPVPIRDSYEAEDERLIGELFGKTPVDRWPAAERLYKDALPRATFKLYPGAAHRITPEMAADVRAFFDEHLGK